MAWAVLEAVVEATADEDGLVAHTSARHLAGLLGLDPGTAAADLRLLAGAVTSTSVGPPVPPAVLPCRLTSSATLSTWAFDRVVPPVTVEPHAADPHIRPRREEPGGATTTSSDQAASGGRRSAKRPQAQGAFDYGPEADG